MSPSSATRHGSINAIRRRKKKKGKRKIPKYPDEGMNLVCARDLEDDYWDKVAAKEALEEEAL